MTLERPKIADLAFRLYDRPLHPELFEPVAERSLALGGATLVARLTATGHVLEWHRGGDHLVEVTAERGHPLPEGHRLLHPFAGERRGRCDLPAVRYQVSLHAEVLPPELFLHVHDELAADGAKRGLLFHFEPHRRLALVPLGFIALDALPTGIAVATFHTFPAECAVVKTQTLIEPV
jgi:Protein of unknown function DUF2617